MGVLRAVGRVELDGERYDDWPEMGAEVSRILRPPPDWRVGVAANQIDEALRVLNAVLGRGLDDESDDEVADLIAGASL
jgi:hypothetical protein